MSVWIENLYKSLDSHPVCILHGNVRDKYMKDGRTYGNLTSLLISIAQSLSQSFDEVIFSDPIYMLRRVSINNDNERDLQATVEEAVESNDDYGVTTTATEAHDWIQMLEHLSRELEDSDTNRFAVIFYLDKYISYKQSYDKQELELLVRLEKLVENITPNNRLIMVALTDSMIPIELYTNAPRCEVHQVPQPGKIERREYLEHKLGENHAENHDFIADMTDGLFMVDLDNIVDGLSDETLERKQIKLIIDKYRLGDQEDYWGQLSIDKLDRAHEWFTEQEGVRGQDYAISKVRDVLCVARAGLSNLVDGSSSKPKGVLFFTGPTGVGKTMVAKKIAKFLFNTEEAYNRLDMSEFKEEHSLSKLIGSPPGYVGFEQGGQLTNFIKEKPFSVILFDEIEKAHPKIMDTFLQILGDGRLTDSRGQTVYFTESVIIFTSNLGTRTTNSKDQPVDERQRLEKILQDDKLDYEQRKELIRGHFLAAVRYFFREEISRPELLNRLGNNIVPFNYIHSRDQQLKVAAVQLSKAKSTYEETYRSQGYLVDFDSQIAEWLVDKHGAYFDENGGRGAVTAVNQEIVVPLSYISLRATHEQWGPTRFTAVLRSDQCEFDFKTEA